MSATTVKMLQAAAEIAGGNQALAERLEISTPLLSAYMTGSRELPDRLLLRAVDVILEERESRLHLAARLAPRPPEEPA